MNQTTLPHDINGLVPAGVPWFLYLIVATGLIVIATAAYIFWRRRSTSKVEPEIQIDPLAKVRALTRELEIEQPFIKERQVLFYHRLSHFMRAFLEHSFSLPATDLTTQELKRQLPNYSKLHHVDSILRFLSVADSIKFSDKENSVAEAEADRDLVLSWMDNISNVTAAGFEFTQREST